jgi:hypothetical protein
MNIGPGGGSVAAGDGASVSIPSGALTASTPITVSTSSAPSPDGTVEVGTPYLFGPEGTQFAQPVTVTLAFDASLLPMGATTADVVVYTAPANTTDYQELATTLTDSGHVAAQTTHFSIFVAAVKKGGNPHDDMSVEPADMSMSMPMDSGMTTTTDQGPTSDGGCAIMTGNQNGLCTVSATCNGHTYLASCQPNACTCYIDGTQHGFVNAPNACSNASSTWAFCGFP